MSAALRRLLEAFSIHTKSGYASPQGAVVYETPTIPLSDVLKFYERDLTCNASVGLLAASTVGSGLYTTVNDDYAKVAQAKTAIDQFNESVNLDALLGDMARMLISCDKYFWLNLTSQNVTVASAASPLTVLQQELERLFLSLKKPALRSA